MAYKTIPFAGFSGGLNLRDQPDTVQQDQCIDCMNVEFTANGGFEQRGGFAEFNPVALTNQPDSLGVFYTTAGLKRLLVGNGNRLDALDASGASTHNAAPTANPHFFARFGSPGSERIYIANGTDSVRYYDGTAFTTPAYTGTAPDGTYLAVTPWDNRMLNARRVGTVGGDTPSTVRFSAPGDPHSWDADDWRELTPGDGEEIMGMVQWREFVFVFKETKFFRFHGTGVDAAGDDDLLQTTFDLGIGLASPRAVVATEYGVFFLGREGVYVTTGGDPKLVSSQIDPLFFGGFSPFFTTGIISQADLRQAAMATWENRIYLAVPTSGSLTNNRMLVYDPRAQWWSIYDVAASALASFRVASEEELLFGYAVAPKKVGRHRPVDSAYLGDFVNAGSPNGTAISSRWRSGWMDFGSPNEKTIRESKLWGAGRADYLLHEDYLSGGQVNPIEFSGATDLFADGSNPADLFADGSNPVDVFAGPGLVTPALVSDSHIGTLFSVEFRNNTLAKTMAIHRLALNMREERVPSVI